MAKTDQYPNSVLVSLIRILFIACWKEILQDEKGIIRLRTITLLKRVVLGSRGKCRTRRNVGGFMHKNKAYLMEFPVT